MPECGVCKRSDPPDVFEIAYSTPSSFRVARICGSCMSLRVGTLLTDWLVKQCKSDAVQDDADAAEHRRRHARTQP
jgi:hypothetical protein